MFQQDGSLRSNHEVQILLQEKFGEYDQNLAYKNPDSDMLLTQSAIDFLRQLLSLDQTVVNIVTKNRKDYVIALLAYQGFSEKEIRKITILASGDKENDVKNSGKELAKDLKSKEEIKNTRRLAFLFDDNKNDLLKMASRLNNKYFKVKHFSATPGKFKWPDYFKTINAQHQTLLRSEGRLFGMKQDFFVNSDKQNKTLEVSSSQENQTLNQDENELKPNL